MVIWSLPARADLKHIHDFIAKDSPYYAKKVAQEIRDKAESLKMHPEIGKMVPEIGLPHIKELSIYSYRIIYEISNDNHEVLTVIHKCRDFKPDKTL